MRKRIIIGIGFLFLFGIQITLPLFLHLTVSVVKFSNQRIVKTTRKEDLKLIILNKEIARNILADDEKEIVINHTWYDIYSITKVKDQYHILVRADNWETKLQFIKNNHHQKENNCYISVNKLSPDLFSIHEKISLNHFPFQDEIVCVELANLKDSPPGKVLTPPPNS